MLGLLYGGRPLLPDLSSPRKIVFNKTSNIVDSQSPRHTETKGEQKDKERGERTQRLAFILFFCSVERMRISHLVQKADSGHEEIRADLDLLVKNEFIQTIVEDEEIWYKATERGINWMQTQFQQYNTMYGSPYITRPPGLWGEDPHRKIRTYLRPDNIHMVANSTVVWCVLFE